MNAHELRNIINKALGEEVVYLGSDERFKTSFLPTGLLPFDILLGGGLPRGRMSEIFGGTSVLKSYVALHAMRITQRSGGVVALIDTEHTFDPVWATQIGVDTAELVLQQPRTGELGIDTAEALIGACVDLLVIDSVAATLPQAEQNKRLFKEQVQPGRLAALMSTGLRKLTAANHKTAILWINQLRSNIGITFGSQEQPPGGRALPYYASIRINIKQTGRITETNKAFDGEKWVDARTVMAQKFRAYIEKSKINRPHREIHFMWKLDEARIDTIGFLMAQALELGIAGQRGSVIDYRDITFKGKAAFRARLEDEARERQWLVTEIMEKHLG